MTDFVVDRMRAKDLDGIMKIETEAFTLPWSRWMFGRELEDQERSRFLVVKNGEEVVGYIGFWMVLDEAHIVTIAVSKDYRRRGIGSILMASALNLAESLGATRATLEVRVSNYAAQGLYRKFGFRKAAIRKNFYADTNEDAYVMWLNDLKERIGEINALVWKLIHGKDDKP